MKVLHASCLLGAVAGAVLAAQPALAAPAKCSTESFEVFVKRFSHDIRVQEKATAKKLVTEYLDDTGQAGDPVKKRKIVPLASVTWPVMPDLAIVKSRAKFKTLPGGAREVAILGDGNGERNVYEFRKQPCWTLVRVSDESM